MKWALLASLGLGVAIVGGLSQEPESLVASGESLFYDMGVVQGKGEVSHTFELKNSSSAPWVLEETRRSCGCMRLAVEPRHVAPGATLTVEVHANVRGRRGPQALGGECYFGGRGPLRVTLKCNVQPSLRASSRYLLFGHIVQGEPAELPLVIELPNGNPLDRAFSSHPDHLSVSVQESTEHSASLRVTALANERGALPRKLSVHVVSSSGDELSVPVLGHVGGPWIAVPSRVVLGAGIPTESGRIRIVPVTTSADIAIEKVSCSSGPGIRCVRDESLEGVAFLASVQGAHADGVCVFTIETGGGPAYTLRVPVLVQN